VRVSQANIHRLPAIVTLVNELRVREAGANVFTSSEVDFHVRADHIYFERFDLHGDAITLKGKGELGLDRIVDLDFYTILGGENRVLPVLRGLVGQASRQFLKIRVSGPIHQPQMTREVLPVLNETLQQLFPEQARSGTGGQDPPAGDLLAPLTGRRWRQQR
jgi:hypothetical protein